MLLKSYLLCRSARSVGILQVLIKKANLEGEEREAAKRNLGQLCPELIRFDGDVPNEDKAGDDERLEDDSLVKVGDD